MYRRAGVITISLLSVILRTRAPSQTADAQGNGVRISIPGGWQWQTSVAQQGGPILLTTFGTRYDRGGIVPPGGAEIDVTRVSAPAALGDYIRADTLEASIVQPAQELALAGADAAIRMSYTDSFGPSLSCSNVTWYVKRGGQLYKFYLTALANQPQWQTWVNTFDALVRNAVYSG